MGKSERKDGGDESRWRSFTRQAIADRLDNLDLSWLTDTEFDTENTLVEPEEVAAAILGHLRSALNEIEALTDELAETAEAEE